MGTEEGPSSLAPCSTQCPTRYSWEATSHGAKAAALSCCHFPPNPKQTGITYIQSLDMEVLIQSSSDLDYPLGRVVVTCLGARELDSICTAAGYWTQDIPLWQLCPVSNFEMAWLKACKPHACAQGPRRVLIQHCSHATQSCNYK